MAKIEEPRLGPGRGPASGAVPKQLRRHRRLMDRTIGRAAWFRNFPGRHPCRFAAAIGPAANAGELRGRGTGSVAGTGFRPI